MRPIIRFSNHAITIEAGSGDAISLPPYFYHYQERMMFGKKAERAIDLYPHLVHNLFEITVPESLQSYFRAFHAYLTDSLKITAYRLLFNSKLTHLQHAAKASLPGIQAGMFETPYVEEPPKHWLGDIRDGASATITNYLIRANNLPNPLFFKVRKIVRVRIDVYIQELLHSGTAQIRLKVVDAAYSVHTINERLSRESIPELDKLLKLYEDSTRQETRLTGALYDVYDNNFKVTFVSPFSFGKSTLINGFFGEKILGMDIRAETAIVTKLLSSSENSLYVKHADDTIVRETFSDYSELSDKLRSFNGVRGEHSPVEVQVRIQSELFPCITFIDAPGLNSRHKEHNDKASETFEMSDMVLFLINPAHLGEATFSLQMKGFIERMEDEQKKYAFVISKMDLYSDDRDTIMKELDIVLSEIDSNSASGDDRVFFISGFFALYGRLLRDGKVELDEVRKAHGIYVLDDEGEMISGRRIEQSHYRSLIDFSNIQQLEQFIEKRGESSASNQFDMDRRE